MEFLSAPLITLALVQRQRKCSSWQHPHLRCLRCHSCYSSDRQQIFCPLRSVAHRSPPTNWQPAIPLPPRPSQAIGRPDCSRSEFAVTADVDDRLTSAGTEATWRENPWLLPCSRCQLTGHYNHKRVCRPSARRNDTASAGRMPSYCCHSAAFGLS